jgi:hypothetical protein
MDLMFNNAKAFNEDRSQLYVGHIPKAGGLLSGKSLTAEYAQCGGPLQVLEKPEEDPWPWEKRVQACKPPAFVRIE